MIIYSIIQAIFLYVLFALYNTKILAFFFMLTIAVVEAEVVEYVEHYGLFMNKDNIVNYECSWNSAKRYTNIASFNLERHSDHHVNGHK